MPSPWKRKPIWKTWRWDIIYLIDRVQWRKWCWSSLVGWAAYTHPIRELTEARNVSGCMPGSPDTARCGACYCGKFREQRAVE